MTIQTKDRIIAILMFLAIFSVWLIAHVFDYMNTKRIADALNIELIESQIIN